MTIDISDNNPRISYTANANGAQTAFAVPFEFFDNTDLKVYVAGVLKSEGTGSANYGVSGGAGSTGTVTFVSGVTASATVVITRSITIERVTDFTAGADINRAALNTQLDTLTAITADLKDSVDRGLILSDSDSSVSTTLPLLASRKGTVLGFNASTGAVEAGPSITAVQSLADVTTAINLLGTSAVVEDLGILGTAAIVEDMGFLGTSANVAAMAQLGTSAVVADMALLGTSAVVADMAILGTSDVVADMAILATTDVVADLNTLATSAIVEDMNLLATSAVIEDMSLLATSAVIEDMGLLATSAVIEDMGLLGTSAVVEDMGLLANSTTIGNMNLLGTSDAIADMNTLGTSSNVTNQNTLAGISGNITTVAGISANVTTVAGDASDINTLVAALSNINLVASNINSGVLDGILDYGAVSDSVSSSTDFGSV